MDLYILRHGKAEERSVDTHSDARRRLTKDGTAEMVRIADALSSLGIRLNYLASSPLKRAMQTAEIVAGPLLPGKTGSKKGKSAGVAVWDELKPEIDVEMAIERLGSLRAGHAVMLVGHEPHLGKLVASMISTRPGGAQISLKKGGFAHVRITSMTHRPRGSLRSVLTPKQMKRLCS